LEFNNNILWLFDAFGMEVWITESIFNTWVIMALLIVIALAIRFSMRGFKSIPSGLQNAVEAVIEAFDNIVKSSAGEKLMGLGNWFFMVFLFILISNLSGIVGARPPTSDWATAFAFALATFILTHAVGIKYRKGKYFKSFIEPSVIFLPLNVIGEIARPLSLSFRLFGNVLAGLILISLIYTMPLYLRFVVPVALHVYFDLLIGALQAYIFCTLSLTFIGMAASSAE
jgi:F-type H+-transporting ATPase subunit a